MFTSVAGRSVVVTGASRGIGLGVAKVFADSCANVLICGRDEQAMRDALDSLHEAPGQIDTAMVDVTDRLSCGDMAASHESSSAISTSYARTRASSRRCAWRMVRRWSSTEAKCSQNLCKRSKRCRHEALTHRWSTLHHRDSTGYIAEASHEMKLTRELFHVGT